jgi:hypothetical protein
MSAFADGCVPYARGSVQVKPRAVCGVFRRCCGEAQGSDGEGDEVERVHLLLLAGRADREDPLGIAESLWTFLDEAIEITNNAAERALRKAVLWRKSCFGNQSEAGLRRVHSLPRGDAPNPIPPPPPARANEFAAGTTRCRPSPTGVCRTHAALCR